MANRSSWCSVLVPQESTETLHTTRPQLHALHYHIGLHAITLESPTSRSTPGLQYYMLVYKLDQLNSLFAAAASASSNALASWTCCSSNTPLCCTHLGKLLSVGRTA